MLLLLLRLEDFNVEDVTLGTGGRQQLRLDGDGDVVLPAGSRGLEAALAQVRGQTGRRAARASTTPTAAALHEWSEAGPDHGLEVLPQPPRVGAEVPGRDPQVRPILPSSTGHGLSEISYQVKLLILKYWKVKNNSFTHHNKKV